MWGFDGNADDADGGVDVELCGAELLGERVRGIGSRERGHDEEEESPDCQGSRGIHGKRRENCRDQG